MRFLDINNVSEIYMDSVRVVSKSYGEPMYLIGTGKPQIDEEFLLNGQWVIIDEISEDYSSVFVKKFYGG